MKRNARLQRLLLREIESIPIASGSKLHSRYFFEKLNNIPSSINQGEFGKINSTLIAIAARERLEFTQSDIDYNLRLLSDQGCVEIWVERSQDSDCIYVRRLTQAGHARLAEMRNPLRKIASVLRNKLADVLLSEVARLILALIGIAWFFKLVIGQAENMWPTILEEASPVRPNIKKDALPGASKFRAKPDLVHQSP